MTDEETPPIICGDCGRHLIAAEEFMGHRWRHETTGWRACDPLTQQGVWGTPEGHES